MRAEKLSIRLRLWTLSLVTVLAVFAVSGVGIAAALQSGVAAREFAERDVASLARAGELRGALSSMGRREMELIVNFESAPLVSRPANNWH